MKFYVARFFGGVLMRQKMQQYRQNSKIVVIVGLICIYATSCTDATASPTQAVPTQLTVNNTATLAPKMPTPTKIKPTTPATQPSTLTSTPIPLLNLQSLQPGQYLVYSAADFTDTSLYLASPDGKSLGKITDQLTGQISPDRHYLSYSIESKEGTYSDMYLLDLVNSSASAKLIAPYCYSSSWSPDSMRLALACNHYLEEPNPLKSFGLDIWVYTIQDGLSVELTDCLHEGIQLHLQSYGCGKPSWSPDGKWIASARGEAKSGYPSSLDGWYLTDTSCLSDISTCSSKTHRPAWNVQDFSWSPDGKYWVAFTQIDQANQISVFALDQKTRQILLNIDGNGVSLVWSPDNQYLAYTQGRDDGGYATYLSKLNGEPPIHLFDDGKVEYWLKVP